MTELQATKADRERAEAIQWRIFHNNIVSEEPIDAQVEYIALELAKVRQQAHAEIQAVCAKIAKDFCDELEPESPTSVKYLEETYGTLDAEKAILAVTLDGTNALKEG